MTILRIEHPVRDFASWKQAFDSDPIGRERSGVRRYSVARASDDPSYVVIDLEFDTREAADSMHAALRTLWGGAAAALISGPRARMFDAVERGQYGGASPVR